MKGRILLTLSLGQLAAMARRSAPPPEASMGTNAQIVNDL